MHQGKLVFSQLMAYLPISTFHRCVAKHRGDYKVKDFSCLDPFFAMAFAQLTYREPAHAVYEPHMTNAWRRVPVAAQPRRN